jgi:hypothetical protein
MKRTIAALIIAVLLASALNASLVKAQPWDDLVLDRPATISPQVQALRKFYMRITQPPQPPIPDDWLCPQWYDVSIKAGFTHDDWPAVGIIAWRESRCFPNVHNGRDPSGGSRGIMQVNGSWRRYLRERDILWDITELHDPLTNMIAARAIVQYDRDRGNCDWKQWSTRQGLC